MKCNIFLGCVLCAGLISALTATALAQAPAKLAGDGVLFEIATGTYPLADHGYGLFLPDNSGNHYRIVGVFNVLDGAGTYSYGVLGTSNGLVFLNDTISAISSQISLGFADSSSGSFALNSTSPAGYSQSGTFRATMGTAPSTLASRSFSCSIADGLFPFAQRGAFTISFSGSGTYTIQGGPAVSSSSGTYSYSALTRSTGVIEFNDAAIGQGKTYLGFDNEQAGGLVSTLPQGGFQIATFSRLDLQDPAITITAPTTAASFVTSANTIDVSGTASDDVGAVAVVWSNDRGGSGSASGTTAWSVGGIPLLIGHNLLSFTASDAAGHLTRATLDVSYTTADITPPGIQIMSPVELTQSSTRFLSFTGSAGDNVGVTKVTWTNGLGGDGEVYPLSGSWASPGWWKADSIPLGPGGNLITFTAFDAAGNTASVSYNISYFGPVDNFSPVVLINSPNDFSSYDFGSAPVNVSGATIEDGSVSKVEWFNDRGGSGVASGTRGWLISGIDLRLGTNVITISAHDLFDNVGLAQLHLILRPPSLAAVPQGELLTLSWSTNGTGFVLEAKSDLGSHEWAPVGGVPAIVEGKYRLTDPIDRSSRLYRLRQVGP